jgi:YD repeat-containing protein
MLRILDVEALGTGRLVTDLPAADRAPKVSGQAGERSAASGCARCAAHAPAPQLDGNLRVDPDIHLPAPGMDVDLSFYYNGNSPYNGPYGYGRTISYNLLAQASGSPTIVTFTRGDSGLVSYQYNSVSGQYVAQTEGLFNSLVQDTTDNLWKETTLDGIVTAYPLDTAGHITSATYIQDAAGNIQTLSYSGGRLASIEEPAGRVVTLAYDTNHLLQSVEDWAGRINTLAYDTTTFSGKPVMTKVTGPTGCVTQYQYSLLNGNPQMTGILDPNGYGTSYAYDQQNRVTARTVSGVGVTTYLYQPGAMLEIDAAGNITT